MQGLMIVVSKLSFFLSHRHKVGLQAKAQGRPVVVVAPPGTDAEHEQLSADGIGFEALTLPQGYGRKRDRAKALWELIRHIRAHKPGVVHLVGPKISMLGAVATEVARPPATVFAVSGLGFLYLNKGRGARVYWGLLKAAYRRASARGRAGFIFQNEDDRGLFLNERMAQRAQTWLFRGSGVDLTRYAPTPEPTDAPVVVIPARLNWDKGVGEFIDAARLLKERDVNVRMVLVGSVEATNPRAVPESAVNDAVASGACEWWGYQTDMASVYARANLVVLPSYREGLPKALCEAAACQRAVITTDVPGCRDALTPGETGLLVPVRDATALAEAIETLLADPDRRHQMAKAGRALAETEFADTHIAALHQELYAAVLA